MNVERLNHLITVMEEAAQRERRFYMGAWVRPEEGDIGVPDLCNTACCALGWAAQDPKCIADGLNLALHWEDDDETSQTLHVTNADTWYRALEVALEHDIEIAPEYQGACGFFAGMNYYEISERASEYLFNPTRYTMGSGYIKPHDVIKHIRDVLEGRFVDEDDGMYSETVPSIDDRPVGFV